VEEMTPEQIAKPGTEAAHQMALFAWAAMNVERFPELKWLHHIPNGGSRGDTEQSRKIEGGKLKAQGVKKGVLDLMLPVRRAAYCGLYIEMKKPDQRAVKFGGASAEQIEFANFVISQGYKAMLCHSWEEAKDELIRYLTS
jgi:hypothetical protein